MRNGKSNTQFTSQQNNILPENFYSQRLIKNDNHKSVTIRFTISKNNAEKQTRYSAKFYFQQRSAL